MKKLILCILIICLLFCSGCAEPESIESKAKRGDIKYIDMTDHVIVDKDTHIMYYYDTQDGDYMIPYYSKNGKLCKYEDGKIIEVSE